MKLVGDAEHIAVLKGLHQKNTGFLQALIADARTTTDRATYFKDDEGTRYKLSFEADGALRVELAPARTSIA